MTRGFWDNNKEIDSEEQSARRRNFISRMERKLEYKQALTDDDDDRSLV